MTGRSVIFTNLGGDAPTQTVADGKSPTTNKKTPRDSMDLLTHQSNHCFFFCHFLSFFCVFVLSFFVEKLYVCQSV